MNQELLEQMNVLCKPVQPLVYTLRSRLPSTDLHQHRVTLISIKIGEALSLPVPYLACIAAAASIHDIGKLAIPFDLLNHSGPLDHDEMILVKKHSARGHEIIKTLDIIPMVKNIILHHHERLDGTGYPSGLRGDQISQETRIVSVADVMDAMMTCRPYKPEKNFNETIDEIKCQQNTHFDEKICVVAIDLMNSRALEDLYYAYHHEYGQHHYPKLA